MQKSSFGHEAARRRLQHDEGLPRVRGDLRRAAGAGQARLRVFVVADHGAVEIAEAIDLRRAEEADVHAPGLQLVAEDLRQRHHAAAVSRQFAIADRQWQHSGRVPMVPDS